MKKATAKKKPRQRDDHAVGFRVNDRELAKLEGDIATVHKSSGIKLTNGAYAKHAAFEHAPIRARLASIRDLVQAARQELENDDAAPNKFLEQLHRILEAP